MTNTFTQKYGPWAMITGGTSGIGEALARQIALKGINLVLVARSENVLQLKAMEMAKQYGVEVKTIQADLSKSNGYEEVIKNSQNLDIGLFIPAAGIENNGFTTDIDLQQELALIQLNVTSTFALTHHFAQKMVAAERGGILLVASLSGHMPNPYLSNYAGSKAYVYNFGTSLHWEMKKKGVDVTVLSPGLTSTPMVEGKDIDFSKTPMSPMTPERVAQIALNGLGKKALVIPGAKNNVMAFMSKHFMSIKSAISMSGKMMEKALEPSKL